MSENDRAIEAALSDLAAAPDDVEKRERAAHALRESGRHDEAVTLLREALTHLNAHDAGSLPCLCRRCLVPAQTEVEVQGRRFVRDFVAAAHAPRGRVLFYWMPDDLVGQERRVRKSVRLGLAGRPPLRRGSNGA